MENSPELNEAGVYEVLRECYDPEIPVNIVDLGLVYRVALEGGVYLFDARRHQLVPVVADDLRALAIGRGQRNLVARAPVQIIYVADVRRLTHTAGFQEPGLRDPDIQKSYYTWTRGSSPAASICSPPRRGSLAGSTTATGRPSRGG